MKRLLVLIIFLLVFSSPVPASTLVYSDNGQFGLKNSTGEVILDAEYKKIVRLGQSAWIVQKATRFGIVSDSGKTLIDLKYNNAERVLGKFAKLKKGDKYGIFDEKGFTILPAEYSSIDLLFGGMFLTCKNYKYGISDFNGQVILDNIFDDIYMPNPNLMVIEYNGYKYEIERERGEELVLPYNIKYDENDNHIRVSEIMSKPGAVSGYYTVSGMNYILKLFSSISPAYEETIEELMYSYGADTVSNIVKLGWLPMFPIVYARNYYQNLKAPNNGPLNGVKTNLKRKLNDN